MSFELEKIENKLKKSNLLFVAPYPPPYGGVSSHILDLTKSIGKIVNSFNIVNFTKNTQLLNIENIYIFNISKFNNVYTKINFFKLTKLFSFFLLNFISNPRLLTTSMFKALNIYYYANKTNSKHIFVYTTKLGALIPFLKILDNNFIIYYSTYADPIINPKFYINNYKWYEKVLNNCDEVFSSSFYCANALTNIFDKVNPKVIYVGVDTELFAPIQSTEILKENYNIPKNKKIILFVGRMEYEMGAKFVFEIADKMLSDNNNLFFIFLGAYGEYTDLLLSLTFKYPLNTICKVNVSNSDLNFYYKFSDIFIAPTIGNHACMGVSIKEAMSSGLPIIASNSGGIPEAIEDDVNGFISKLMTNGEINIDDFIYKLKFLINNEHKCIYFSNNTRNIAHKNFSNTQTYYSYLNLLNKHLNYD